MNASASRFGYLLIAVTILFHSCRFKKSGESRFASDPASIAKGKIVFDENCSGCHNFKQDGIGPKLNGITQRVASEWLMNFIRDPKKNIESGDERSKILFDKYHTIMPSFTRLTDENLGNILAYIHTRKEDPRLVNTDSNYIKNPFPDKIPLSNLVVNLKEIIRIPASSDELPRTRIAKLDYQPSSKKLFVLDLRGKLYMISNNLPLVYMDMRSLRKSFIDNPGFATGFGSFSFHPEFEKNGLLYTTHTESKGSAVADFSYRDSIPVALQWVLTEWKTGTPDAVPFTGQSRELLRINMVTVMHGMQEITFNPLSKPGDKDYGLLYIGIGDGGCVEDNFSFLAHNTAAPWGTIFRIDPKGTNSSNGKYGIPSDNPFVNDREKLKEIYAYGFRNPHRITWSAAGQMIASNIGQSNIEAVNIILPGRDYGWPIREGKFMLNPYGDISKVYHLPSNDSLYNIVYPVAAFDHDEGKAVSGGFEYTGTRIRELKGKYLFGDISNGRLFYVEMKDLQPGKQAPIKEWQVSVNGKPIALSKLCGDIRPDLRLGKDADGEMYIFTKADGKIYRLGD